MLIWMTPLKGQVIRSWQRCEKAYFLHTFNFSFDKKFCNLVNQLSHKVAAAMVLLCILIWLTPVAKVKIQMRLTNVKNAYILRSKDLTGINGYNYVNTLDHFLNSAIWKYQGCKGQINFTMLPGGPRTVFNCKYFINWNIPIFQWNFKNAPSS